jgi:hypothetical protein
VSYREQPNRHLSLDNRDVLGIEAEGIYRRDGLVRPHILPIVTLHSIPGITLFIFNPFRDFTALSLH